MTGVALRRCRRGSLLRLFLCHQFAPKASKDVGRKTWQDWANRRRKTGPVVAIPVNSIAGPSGIFRSYEFRIFGIGCFRSAQKLALLMMRYEEPPDDMDMA